MTGRDRVWCSCPRRIVSYGQHVDDISALGCLLEHLLNDLAIRPLVTGYARIDKLQLLQHLRGRQRPTIVNLRRLLILEPSGVLERIS
jgi:hypothetical protein